MAFDHWPVRLAIGAALLAALSLAACGRKGELDLPPSAAAAEPAAAPTVVPATPGEGFLPGSAAVSGKNGFDANGNPVAPKGEKKPFLLDPLLD